MRPYGIQVGNIKIVTLRVFCLPRWSFFLWHVTRSCSSRWRRGSSRRSRLGPGEGWESLSSRHSAAVWLWTRETLGLHEAAQLPAAVLCCHQKLRASLDGQAGCSVAGHGACGRSESVPVCQIPAGRVFLEAQYFCWLSWVILYSSCS